MLGRQFSKLKIRLKPIGKGYFWGVTIGVLLLSACTTTMPTKTYYQLPLQTERQEKSTVFIDRQVWLEDLTLADYINGSGIVYQTSEVRYSMAQNNLWASDLSQQLRQSLLESLNEQISGWFVTARPQGRTDNRLKVHVTEFHGRYDGQAIIAGEWSFSQQGKIITRNFKLMVAQTDDGYDALVVALSTAWQEQAGKIAKELIPILSPPVRSVQSEPGDDLN